MSESPLTVELDEQALAELIQSGNIIASRIVQAATAAMNGAAPPTAVWDPENSPAAVWDRETGLLSLPALAATNFVGGFLAAIEMMQGQGGA